LEGVIAVALAVAPALAVGRGEVVATVAPSGVMVVVGTALVAGVTVSPPSGASVT